MIEDGEFNEAIGEAIKACIAGRITQVKMADALGCTQSEMSRYLRGRPRPSLERLANIEELSGRPRGWILAQAGLVTVPGTVEELIDFDPELPAAVAETLKVAVQAGRQFGRIP